jgi:hypothetical protein
MNIEGLKAEIGRLSEITEAHFDRTGEILPTVIFDTGDPGEGHRLATQAPRGLTKAEYLWTIRQAIKMMDAVAVYQIDEAWVVKIDKSAPHPEGSLEHVAGRDEVVMIIGECADGAVMSHRPIIRTKEGKRLGPLEFYPEGNLAGRYAGLFERPASAPVS